MITFYLNLFVKVVMETVVMTFISIVNIVLIKGKQAQIRYRYNRLQMLDMKNQT